MIIQTMEKGDKIITLKTVQSFEKGFEEIYTEYFKPLYLYARRISQSEDLAKDVVSDVFYTLWKTQTDFSQIRELKSYLFRAVKNEVIRTLSKNPRDFVDINSEHFIKKIENVDPEEILIEKELLLTIDELVSKLPYQRQLVFTMAKNKQMSYQEIADELGISVSTVKTQVSRAVASIRQAIEDKYEEEEGSGLSNLGVISLLILTSLILG